ncbi:hypothetical protein HPP92_028556 [Vanilla planifolia]|uniref:Uncharacterized protein n=1 Tax=Vanilla planifolia TaxID=51239 RepID=A0A835P596_VANPL|nr:hypothetical protein HPP92_028556 [Vanilla planifolia]
MLVSKITNPWLRPLLVSEKGSAKKIYRRSQNQTIPKRDKEKVSNSLPSVALLDRFSLIDDAHEEPEQAPTDP